MMKLANKGGEEVDSIDTTRDPENGGHTVTDAGHLEDPGGVVDDYNITVVDI